MHIGTFTGLVRVTRVHHVHTITRVNASFELIEFITVGFSLWSNIIIDLNRPCRLIEASVVTIERSIICISLHIDMYE